MARVRGLVRVTFAVPVELDHGRRGRLVARGRPQGRRGDAVVLGAGEVLEVVMTGLPLRYVHENILVGHGDARGAVPAGDSVVPVLSVADKREWLQAGAAGVLAGGRRVAGGSIAATWPRTTSPRRPGWSTKAARTRPYGGRTAGHEAHLRRLRSFMPEVYLAVSLRPAGRSGFGDGVMRGLTRAATA